MESDPLNFQFTLCIQTTASLPTADNFTYQCIRFMISGSHVALGYLDALFLNNIDNISVTWAPIQYKDDLQPVQ